MTDRRGDLLRWLVHGDNRFGESGVPQQAQQPLRMRREAIWEDLWGLLGAGLIYLDPEGQDVGNWRWKLTSTGRQVAAGGPWDPGDPSGYVRRLREQVPDIDELAVRYLEEALRAFNARCYLASSVLLGVASEQVVLRLAGAFVASGGPGAEKLRPVIEDPRRTYATKFRELRKRLEPERGTLPDELGDALTLDAVADLLRVTRNAAGHPSDRVVGEDTARIHLQMAALYLAKMTALTRHFAAAAARDPKET